jgi:hypothetical protein
VAALARQLDDDAVRPVVLVVVVGLFAGSCGGGAERPTLEGTAFTAWGAFNGFCPQITLLGA